jgi:hypothetical protein
MTHNCDCSHKALVYKINQEAANRCSTVQDRIKCMIQYADAHIRSSITHSSEARMIVRRVECADGPNQVGVYLTADQLVNVDAVLVEQGIADGLHDLPEERWRDYCRSILDLGRRAAPKRQVVDTEEGMRFDSDQLGYDLVQRFAPPDAADLFNPDYSPVDVSFWVFAASDRDSIDTYLADADDYSYEEIERVLSAARLVISFSLTPPNLA